MPDYRPFTPEELHKKRRFMQGPVPIYGSDNLFRTDQGRWLKTLEQHKLKAADQIWFLQRALDKAREVLDPLAADASEYNYSSSAHYALEEISALFAASRASAAPITQSVHAVVAAIKRIQMFLIESIGHELNQDEVETVNATCTLALLTVSTAIGPNPEPQAHPKGQLEATMLAREIPGVKSNSGPRDE